MFGRVGRGGFGKNLAGLVFFFFVLSLLFRKDISEQTSLGMAVKQELAKGIANGLYVLYMPSKAEYSGESSAGWLVRTQTRSLLPVYGMNAQIPQEDYLIAQETVAPDVNMEAEEPGNAVQTTTMPLVEEDLLALMDEENQAASTTPFVPSGKRVVVNLEELNDYETLVKQFYTIDANTQAGTGQLNLQKLIGQDLSIEKKDDGPQILIYHTHSLEAFADSVPGDSSTSIVGVGERLAEILREEYGYQVLHHTGQYDASRDDAYGKALPALQEILTQNPSIEVVIDLHRDQMPEETKLVMDLDGRPTARFMFFNGLSHTRQSGGIDYLKNDNLDANLAMSFQMQLKCEEYYPGLTRKIYLKGYRYNMHLCPRTLLVELGAQNNTVEEAMNACDPLAHVLNMVLSGQ